MLALSWKLDKHAKIFSTCQCLLSKRPQRIWDDCCIRDPNIWRCLEIGAREQLTAIIIQRFTSVVCGQKHSVASILSCVQVTHGTKSSSAQNTCSQKCTWQHASHGWRQLIRVPLAARCRSFRDWKVRKLRTAPTGNCSPATPAAALSAREKPENRVLMTWTKAAVTRAFSNVFYYSFIIIPYFCLPPRFKFSVLSFSIFIFFSN